jgi:hypothetical protein
MEETKEIQVNQVNPEYIFIINNDIDISQGESNDILSNNTRFNIGIKIRSDSESSDLIGEDINDTISSFNRTGNSKYQPTVFFIHNNNDLSLDELDEELRKKFCPIRTRNSEHIKQLIESITHQIPQAQKENQGLGFEL